MKQLGMVVFGLGLMFVAPLGGVHADQIDRIENKVDQILNRMDSGGNCGLKLESKVDKECVNRLVNSSGPIWRMDHLLGVLGECRNNVNPVICQEITSAHDRDCYSVAAQIYPYVMNQDEQARVRASCRQQTYLCKVQN